MHPGLGREVAVGVLAGDQHGRALDARLLARLHVRDVLLVAAPVAPAQVHAQQHLRPVLASVPPAPALIVRIALARSCSPPSIFWNSSVSTVLSKASSAVVKSFSTSSPPASQSASTCASSSWPLSRFTSSRSDSRRLRRCSCFWAPFGSFHRPGSASFCSSASSSGRSLLSSKIAADVHGPRSQRFVSLPQVCAQVHFLESILGPVAVRQPKLAKTSARATAAQARAKTSPWRV